MTERKTFETGAVRSADADGVRFDLITPIGLRKIAERYALGAKKYGDNNWLKGIPASDLVNHGLRHLNLWLAGDKSDDHIAGVLWNFLTLAHFQETRPELIDIPAITDKLPNRRLAYLERFIGRSYFNSKFDFTKDEVVRWENQPDDLLMVFVLQNGREHSYGMKGELAQEFKEWYGVRE